MYVSTSSMMIVLRCISFSFLFFLALLDSSGLIASEARTPDAVLEIPMRDEVKLPANLYLPKNLMPGQKVACVLVRHPLGRDQTNPVWFDLVDDGGYALVIQSTRSCCDESGTIMPYLTDGWSLSGTHPVDGYDTVQWLSSQPFCNGKIATIGVSATGITQLLMAPSAPPNLVCQHIEMAAPSMYQYAVFPGGQFRKEQVEGWLKVHRRQPSVAEWLKQRSRYDTFWSKFNAIDYADQIRVPQLHVGGWFDIFLQGTIDAFIAAKEHSQAEVRKSHKLVIGPWGHRWRHSGKVGPFTLSQSMLNPPVQISQRAWLDCHLKGSAREIAEAPAVQYYVMGPFDGSKSRGNIWRTATTWPPEGSRYIELNFAKDKAGKDKLLAKDETSDESATFPITYDPSNPVPTVGGRNLFMPDGPLDITSVAARNDVLLLTTDALKEDMEVTGRLYANIYVGDLNDERDLCLRLVDITPKGEHYIIAEGVSHVLPTAQTEAKASQPRLVVVDLWTTSMVFAEGHKIGLLISASNYPAYDLSPVAADRKSTGYTIYSGPKTQSRLMLPVMETVQADK